MEAMRYRIAVRWARLFAWCALATAMMLSAAVGHAIELRNVAECSQPAPYAYCVITEPALSPDGGCIAVTYSELWPPIYEWWPFVFGVAIDGECTPAAYGVGLNLWYESPAWSPDGQHLAYVAGGYEAQNIGIWTIAVGDTGTPPRSLLHVATGGFGNPAWSLDGLTIACEMQGGIYTVPAAGGTPTLMISDGLSPSWGPEGQIAFAREGDLWIRGVDGSERRIKHTAEVESSPSWSPQGVWIAYVSNRSGTPDIWVIAASGGTPVQVSSGPAWDGHPSWSARGDRLAFERVVDQQESSIWLAIDLPDWTIAVEQRTWSDVKKLFR